MILNDDWIRQQGHKGMISPFVPELVREVVGVQLSPAGPESYDPIRRRCLSYGLSSYGYDLRLSPVEFLVFRHVPGTIVDPKDFRGEQLEPVPLNTDHNDSFFILPAHSYGLGVALERLEMPPDVTGICLGKSTYARLGVIANMTPVEAGWKGNLTLELSNSSGADCRIYANEGICQVLFFRGDPCSTTYDDRSGKYQDQSERVTLAKV